jgi:uncharacterized membrane protein YdjX (TVP38/TMEM64 family)
MTSAHAHTTVHHEKRKRGSKVRWILIGAGVIALIAALQWLPVGDWIESAKGWFEDLGAFGPIVFVALYVAIGLLLLPASAMTIAAGSIFGLWLGFLWAVIAANLTAIAAFLVARHLARGALERKLKSNERFKELDDAIGAGTWKIVALVRLSPIVPFSFANYAMGLTQVGFGPYCLATFLGMLPGTFVYVYLGYVGAESLHGGSKSTSQWILLGVGLVASAALVFWLTRMARAKLRHGKKGTRKQARR